ncbi:hypothetical protein F2Q69_00005039 [Brassica cretica]|uniref:Uncharacterized protein n=1 Tax=Brassica cretica TaxID=69181 RepID=A0A8S9PKV0_BRACR|nr:hypothetical protein F2Q69_00005039 [Brassica cretica]
MVISVLLCYQLAVASHLRLGSSSSLSTQSWLVVVIEFVFRPADELRGSASSSAVASHLRLLLPLSSTGAGA